MPSSGLCASSARLPRSRPTPGVTLPSSRRPRRCPVLLEQRLGVYFGGAGSRRKRGLLRVRHQLCGARRAARGEQQPHEEEREDDTSSGHRVSTGGRSGAAESIPAGFGGGPAAPDTRGPSLTTPESADYTSNRGRLAQREALPSHGRGRRFNPTRPALPREKPYAEKAARRPLRAAPRRGSSNSKPDQSATADSRRAKSPSPEPDADERQRRRLRDLLPRRTRSADKPVVV